MGQAPGTGEVSLRTIPRNFPGRSGTKDDQVYLCSPETSAAAALKGVITDPRDLAKEMAYPRIQDPAKYSIDETSIIFPTAELRKTTSSEAPISSPFPELDPFPETLEAEVVLKVGDNISTDAIMPAGNKILPLRSNIEALSEFMYSHRSTRILPRNAEKKERWSSSAVKITGRDPAANMRPWRPVSGGSRQNRQELRPHP